MIYYLVCLRRDLELKFLLFLFNLTFSKAYSVNPRKLGQSPLDRFADFGDS